MIDFSLMEDIQINGKKLLIWISASHPNTYLWKRQPEYPYLIIGTAFNSSGTVGVAPAFSDKYKLTVPMSINEDGTFAYTTSPKVVLDIHSSLTTSSNITSQVNIGRIYKAYKVANNNEYENFPRNIRFTEPTIQELEEYEVSDAEWSVSDEETGQITLYSIGNIDESYNPGRIFHSYEFYEANTKEAFVNNMGSLSYWPTMYYEIGTPDTRSMFKTAAVVDIEAPLITLSDRYGSTTEVASIRTNFTDYKTKYDTATGGEYPKSLYPYLRGVVKIDCKSNSLGINGTWGMFVGFTVRR